MTLSLASLGLGFQQDHYGLFLVAALSGLAFWVLEATTKLHQMRAWAIDWSWSTAKWRFVRLRRRDLQARDAGRWPKDPRTPTPWPQVLEDSPMRPWLWPHVMLPHAVSLVAGAMLCRTRAGWRLPADLTVRTDRSAQSSYHSWRFMADYSMFGRFDFQSTY